MAIAVHYQTEYFFDRPAVQKMVRELGMEGPRLNRAGALVRTIARGMIRRRVKRTTVSPAGAPPFSKDPAGRYKRIEYRWDPSKKGVVVGHVSYPNKMGGYVPDVQEFGLTTKVNRLIIQRGRAPAGMTEAGRKRRNRAFKKLMQTYGPSRELWRNRQLATGSDRRRARQRLRVESVKYPARPVMGPALARAMEKLPGMWANSLE